MTHKTRTFLRIGASAIAFLALMTAVPAEPRTGLCIRADIDESIVLPDGSSHPPGVLKVCLERQFSPVAGLHETSVNGDGIGLFLSRFRWSEGPAADSTPTLVFRRIPAGGLRLLGYAVPGRERTSIYWMDNTGRPGSPDIVASATAEPDGPREEVVDGIELIAATHP